MTARSRIAYPLLGFLILTLGTPQPGAASHINKKFAHAAFWDTQSTYKGIRANWNDENWSIQCSGVDGHPNRVNSYVAAFSAQFESQEGFPITPFLHLGSKKKKKNENGCTVVWEYWWERVYHSGDGTYSYNSGVISAIDPPRDTQLSLNRMSSNCASGISWCWNFRIGTTTYHTCCGDQLQWENALEVQVAVECVWFSPGSDCPNSGEVDQYDLDYRNLNGDWIQWQGRDHSCVDHSKKVRGKWATDTRVRGGFNIAMPDSLTNACGP